VKLWTSNLARRFIGSIQTKAIKNFGEPKIFWIPPIISGTGEATDFKFGTYIHGVHWNKSGVKNFGEMGAWGI